MADSYPSDRVWILLAQRCLPRRFVFAILMDAITNSNELCCGTVFSVEHALSCPKGGFPSIRHNAMRSWTSRPTSSRSTGEHLAGASTNTQDGAQLDIAANGLWGGHFERTYFDVRVFNPHAPSKPAHQPRHLLPQA